MVPRSSFTTYFHPLSIQIFFLKLFVHFLKFSFSLFLSTTTTATKKDLFQRAILLSGSSLSNWALAEQPEFYTRTLASKVDCDTRTLDSRTSLPSDSSLPLSKPPNAEPGDLFRSIRSPNRTTSSQLSNSDERIFQCLRSRSSEQLRTASIRLTGAYYSPFYSLFGPQVDSLLISDDQVQQLARQMLPNPLNHSSSHKKLMNRFTVANSDHDLLIGFSSNAPRFRPALKQLLQTLSSQSTNSGLHLFYLFLSDFVGHVNGLLRDGSLNDQNDFDDVATLQVEQLLGAPSASAEQASNAGSNSNGNSSTNWLFTKQTDLLNVISPLLLDALVSLCATPRLANRRTNKFYLPSSPDCCSTLLNGQSPSSGTGVHIFHALWPGKLLRTPWIIRWPIRRPFEAGTRTKLLPEWSANFSHLKWL